MLEKIRFIIAIDGASAAGKGTLGRALAQKYNLAHLDTGLLYRAVAYAALNHGIDISHESEVARIAVQASHLDLKTLELRTEQVGEAASVISAYPTVRDALFQYQRHFAFSPPETYQGAVLDGRDIGTIICPEAPLKFFISATLETRSKRRFKELQNSKIQSIYTSVLQGMKDRDQRDQDRLISPLVPAPDACIIDTSELSPQEVLKKAIDFIENRVLDLEASKLLKIMESS